MKEEVSLRKTAEERTETVSDNVRQTKVEVEDDRKTGAARTANPAGKERARDI